MYHLRKGTTRKQYWKHAKKLMGNKFKPCSSQSCRANTSLTSGTTCKPPRGNQTGLQRFRKKCGLPKEEGRIASAWDWDKTYLDDVTRFVEETEEEKGLNWVIQLNFISDRSLIGSNGKTSPHSQFWRNYPKPITSKPNQRKQNIICVGKIRPSGPNAIAIPT